ncbi:TPA: dihydrodipicolinate synthase family protein, partial [Candidatus Bathyarchaeota archaeon]|nr:dihydrodipicolinate synthase family protein [Candidatus Bathyarchaeota archaeon]
MELEELRSRLFKGAVLVVLLTPFKDGGGLDEEGLRENIRFLLERSRGRLDRLVLVPTGSTGEFYALTDEERRRVIEITVEEAGGKVIVIAGTAQAGTEGTVVMSRYAEDVGADAVMVVLPYYHIPSEGGMYMHYRRLGEEVDVGIVVYNNPSTSKCYIFPPLMARLVADVPNIVAVKENTTHIATYYRMMRAVGDRVPVFCGLGEFWYAVEALFGCPGFVSGFANFAPELSLELKLLPGSGCLRWPTAKPFVCRRRFGPPDGQCPITSDGRCPM